MNKLTSDDDDIVMNCDPPIFSIALSEISEDDNNKERNSD